MRQWTTQERQRQAELIKQWQPWQHSTGARTVEGKAISARNAYKGGLRQQLKAINQLLRNAKQVLKEIN
ncbi:MAG: hypothetical protein H7Z20_04130 [Bdellovibrio sp.]|nr:hypothetical protein [Methylotenera sp.]